MRARSIQPQSTMVPVQLKRHPSKHLAENGHDWPRSPACLRADMLHLPPEGARITVAGLVILRQRPGTANGVIFITLEDETGIVNVIVWRKMYERFRRAVIAGRLLRVTGRLQRAHSVTHLIAEKIEDISPMLDLLLQEQGRDQNAGFAPKDELS